MIHDSWSVLCSSSTWESGDKASIGRGQKEGAASEDRTHDLRIMRPTRCQLRYRRCKRAFFSKWYSHVASIWWASCIIGNTKRNLAERGFDPRTFGLWAQHANHCATPLMDSPFPRLFSGFRNARHSRETHNMYFPIANEKQRQRQRQRQRQELNRRPSASECLALPAGLLQPCPGAFCSALALLGQTPRGSFRSNPDRSPHPSGAGRDPGCTRQRVQFQALCLVGPPGQQHRELNRRPRGSDPLWDRCAKCVLNVSFNRFLCATEVLRHRSCVNILCSLDSHHPL